MEELREFDPKTATDEEVLQAVLLQEEEAWKELMRRFRPLIFRCILKVMKRYDVSFSPEDVSEIFGEVCIGLLRDDMRKLRAYDPRRGARLSSWLGLLAINAAHDFLRQMSRRPVTVHIDSAGAPHRDLLVEQPAQDPSPLDRVLERERLIILNRALSRFSLRDRCFVELYYKDGLSPEAVAQTMGISVKTVYSKKNKLRSRLLRMLHHHNRRRIRPHDRLAA